MLLLSLLVYCTFFVSSRRPATCLQELPRNRLSKFEYFAGDSASTLASEEVLITSTPKLTDDHSGGWVGFKPSAYGDTVRKTLCF